MNGAVGGGEEKDDDEEEEEVKGMEGATGTGGELA